MSCLCGTVQHHGTHAFPFSTQVEGPNGVCGVSLLATKLILRAPTCPQRQFHQNKGTLAGPFVLVEVVGVELQLY